jgi:cytochrome c553
MVSGVVSDAPAQQQSQGDPQLDYMLQCQGCHGADGNGTPAVGVPTLIGLADRFLELPEGRAYLVGVPGVTQAPLDNRAIANLMNWILRRYAADPAEVAFKPYSEEEVAAHRAKVPIDVVATRARLLGQATGSN